MNSKINDIFLTLGWFRSGTTHLYELLKKALPGWTHYYEPFHPKLAKSLEVYRKEKAANPDRDILIKEPLHQKVLFQEYFKKPGAIDNHYQPRFGACDFFLDAEADFDCLVDYLQALASVKTPVNFQVNRGLGRIDFIKSVFPRAVWASWHDQPEDPFSAELPGDKFKLDRMLEEVEDVLAPEDYQDWGFKWAHHRPPVAVFLVMWSFLYSVALRAADNFRSTAIVQFEDLIADSESLLKKMSHSLDLPLETGELPASYSTPIRKWRRNSSPEEYQEFLADLPAETPLLNLMRSFDYWSS